MEGTVAGETIAEEPLAERSANEKGTVNKKFSDWLLLNDFFPISVVVELSSGFIFRKNWLQFIKQDCV